MVHLSLNLLLALAAARGSACLPDPRELWKLHAEDPKLVSILTRHGIGCRAQGDFASAETLLERVVFLVEHNKGKDAVELAGPLSNLAAVYQDQGRRLEAEPLLQKAYRLAQNADAETRAFVENNLALLYWESGNVVRAEPLLRRSVSGLQGPARLAMLANLATLYRFTGRLAESEELTRQILQSDETSWQAWRNLAAIHRLRRDYLRAEAALSRALAIAADGPHRPETLHEQSLLAIANQDWPRAGESIEQAIAHEETLFGGDSVNLIPYLDVQTKILRQRKQKEKAKQVALRARLLRAAL